MAVRAVRGAIQVEADDRELLIAAVAELIDTVMTRNELSADDLISVLFTSTTDLTSEFPAYAARKAGITGVPFMCATEIPVPGSMPRVVRLMAHIETDRPRDAIKHVYLRGAMALRSDLSQ